MASIISLKLIYTDLTFVWFQLMEVVDNQTFPASEHLCFLCYSLYSACFKNSTNYCLCFFFQTSDHPDESTHTHTHTPPGLVHASELPRRPAVCFTRSEGNRGGNEPLLQTLLHKSLCCNPAQTRFEWQMRFSALCLLKTTPQRRWKRFIWQENELNEIKFLVSWRDCFMICVGQIKWFCSVMCERKNESRENGDGSNEFGATLLVLQRVNQ